METNSSPFTLEKMSVIHGDPVEYFLEMPDEKKILLNQFLGKKISLKHTGLIFCLHCEKKTKKSFNQGYCYPCFMKLAQCDLCIMKPETCHFDKGTCREPDWANTHCNIDHIVYLANSSGLKVGITRKTQIPVRWIDQGATSAVPLFQVESRFFSGLLEVAIKKYVTDRTQWQKMLKGEEEIIDLNEERKKIYALVEDEAKKLDAVFLKDEPIRSFHYPVLEYPTKVKSFSLEKDPEVQGVLKGIKGQYLIFDSGVINLRKYGGYQMILNEEKL